MLYQLNPVSPKFYDILQDLHPPSPCDKPVSLALYDCAYVCSMASWEMLTNAVPPRRTLASEGAYLSLSGVFCHLHLHHCLLAHIYGFRLLLNPLISPIISVVNIPSYFLIQFHYLHQQCGPSSTTGLVLPHLSY